MVLSLAFILAFIGSAVALVIGILIFSDVSEAMSLTLPILDFDSITDLEQNSRDGSTMIAVNTAHLPSTYNNLPLTDPVISVKVPILGIDEDDGAWFAREHCASGVVACSNTNENRVKFQGTGVSFQMNTFLSASVLTDGYLGKVFDKAKLANKEITIEVSQGAFANSAMTANLF